MTPPRLFLRTKLAIVLACLLPPARGETTASVPTGSVSGVDMRLATPLTVMPQSGFLPVRVSIRNRMTRAGTWKLRFLAGSPEAPTGTIASTMELAVEPGQDRDFWYFVPLADAAPRFTLGESPDPNAGPRPAINLTVPVAPSTSEVESRAQAKLGYGNRQRWTTRMERGDRPGEVIGIAVATQSVSYGAPLPTGRDLALGFDVEDAFDPVTGVYNRRYFYKESVPDPAGGSSPKSSYWSTVNSSLTAESAARRALEGTGLLAVPPDVGQTVEVTAMESGFSGRQVAWLTTFAQTGSPRVLPLQTGFSLPPGVIVNLHATGRPGEVVRTITFVEPSTLVPPNAAEARPGNAAEEARATLLRYGFLRPRPDVTVTTDYSGPGGFVLPSQHKGAIVWFEAGPARQLPKPLFGSLPPDTVAYLLPGTAPDEVIRCFVVAPRLRLTAPTVAGGAGPGGTSQFSVVVTGSGVMGAAEISFPALQSPQSGLALPVGISSSLTAKLRQTLYNAGARGMPNLTGFDVATMPADWRFFSPYHLVFLRGAEYAALDPARKSALHDWVLQGGQLMIEPVAVYSPFDLPLIEPRVPLERRPYGAGMITQLSYLLDDYLAPMDIDESIPDQPVWVKMAEPVELLPLLRLHQPALTLPSDEALRQPRRSSEIDAADSAGDGKWAVVILAGFALLAGPANLLFFAPVGRRHRLFFTAPLLAVLFSGALAACIVIWEGFGGTGDRAAVVMLVPGENRAVVFQDQMAGTTLLGRRRFAVPDDAALVNTAVDGFDATGREAVLERSEGAAGGDWFRNHWGSAQHLRRIVTTTGSVKVHPDASGAMVAESTLPGTLRGFVYLELANRVGSRVWYAPEVPAGTPVTLRRLVVRQWPPVRPSGSPYLTTVLASVAPLEPGRWMARTGATPIAPLPTLGSITWRDDVVFTGLAEVR